MLTLNSEFRFQQSQIEFLANKGKSFRHLKLVFKCKGAVADFETFYQSVKKRIQEFNDDYSLKGYVIAEEDNSCIKS